MYGYPNYGLHLDSVEVLDLAAAQWRLHSPMLSPRRGHQAVSSGDKIYILGGSIPNNTEPLSDDESALNIDEFDPSVVQ